VYGFLGQNIIFYIENYLKAAENITGAKLMQIDARIEYHCETEKINSKFDFFGYL